MSRPEISAIWAQTADGVIGRDGTMPWHVPEDFAHFKASTVGHPVIMGRRTWESFPEKFRPLPGRTNIVVTSRPESLRVEPEATAVVVVNSYAEAVAAAERAPGGEQIWVIGGGQLYERALADDRTPVTRAVVSVLELDADGDTFAPALGPGWELTDPGEPRISRTGARWRIDTWQRA